MKILLLSAVAWLLAGCATIPKPDANAIAEAGSGMVQGCHMLGTVNGSSLMDGVLQAKGVQSAQAQAKGEAAKWGANTVVWTHITQRYWGAELVTGTAYRCQRG